MLRVGGKGVYRLQLQTYQIVTMFRVPYHRLIGGQIVREIGDGGKVRYLGGGYVEITEGKGGRDALARELEGLARAYNDVQMRMTLLTAEDLKGSPSDVVKMLSRSIIGRITLYDPTTRKERTLARLILS